MRGEIVVLADEAAVRGDGDQVGMEQAVERLDVARPHRRLERTLRRQHVVHARTVASRPAWPSSSSCSHRRPPTTPRSSTASPRSSTARTRVGEEGIWLPGTDRIGADAVAAAIRAGELLGATLDGALVGCGRALMLDATTGEVGLVSAAPEAWGAGVGRALVRAAEERLAARGATGMQLELLVPRGWEQPHKARLRGWYERLGYRVVRTAPFGEIAAPGADRLAGPAEFLIFRKPLQPLGGSERA